MTPKMIAALRDAANADNNGGLQRSVAGWSVKGTYHWHKFRTVDALLARCHLQVFGGVKGVPLYACVTEAGFQALADAGFARDGRPL